MQGKADRVTQQHGEDLGSVLARLTLDRVGCCCCLQTYLDVLGKWAGGIHDRIHAGALNVYVCEVNIGHLHWVLSALRAVAHQKQQIARHGTHMAISTQDVLLLQAVACMVTSVVKVTYSPIHNMQN